MKILKLLCAGLVTSALIACKTTGGQLNEKQTSLPLKSDQSMMQPKTDMNGTRYWVTQPGHPVYNSSGEILRSMRLQASVVVYELRGERALISREKDEWVNLSDVTREKPDKQMIDPKNETGMPRVQLPQSKD